MTATFEASRADPLLEAMVSPEGIEPSSSVS